MTHGSNQLRTFRRARRDGHPLPEAAALAGFSLLEAEAWAKDDDENPPPPEAYRLLGEGAKRSAGSAFAAAQTDDPVNRHPDDYYPTHPGATRALLAVERFNGPIWEPACGEGDMSRLIEAAGYDVISTDLIDRGYGEGGRDFLMEWQPRAPNIVTNPPFKEAKTFVERALQLTTGKVAMFLRLAFLEGVERGGWLPKTPLARVWVMSRRVPMQRGRLSEAGDGHGVIAFAWFVWEHGHTGPATIGFLDWKDHEPVAAAPVGRAPMAAAEPAPLFGAAA